MNQSRQGMGLNLTSAEQAKKQKGGGGHVYNDIKNSDIKLTNNTNEQYCTPWVDVNIVINIFVIYISYKSQTHGYEEATRNQNWSHSHWSSFFFFHN